MNLAPMNHLHSLEALEDPRSKQVVVIAVIGMEQKTTWHALSLTFAPNAAKGAKPRTVDLAGSTPTLHLTLAAEKALRYALTWKGYQPTHMHRQRHDDVIAYLRYVGIRPDWPIPVTEKPPALPRCAIHVVYSVAAFA